MDYFSFSRQRYSRLLRGNKFILLVLTFGLSLSALAQTCEYENDVFYNKEKLTYQVFYNVSFVWIPAGEFTMEVKESENEYLIEATGKTYESYNSFFEVNDYFRTVVDKSTGRPKNFLRKMDEGGYTKYDSVFFDHKLKVATGSLGKTRETAKEYAIEIGECVHDIISIIYAFRNVDLNTLEKKQKIPFTLTFDKKSFPLELEYNGIVKQKIKNHGKLKCHLIKPEVVASSVFDEDTEMSIWVTDDKNQIALMAESPISVGSVKAVLKSVEGIDYEIKKP